MSNMLNKLPITCSAYWTKHHLEVVVPARACRFESCLSDHAITSGKLDGVILTLSLYVKSERINVR